MGDPVVETRGKTNQNCRCYVAKNNMAYAGFF